MKLKKVIISIISIISLILLTIGAVELLNFSVISINKQSINDLSNRSGDNETNAQYQGMIINVEKLVANSTNETTMKNNTAYLQQYIDTASNAGGGLVKIPSGIYYFKPAAANSRNISEYVIKCKDNVILEGSGTSGNTGTVLKPYAPSNKLPVDMFYYNDYVDSNGQNKTFLKNADYRNFVIDGANASATIYNSAGKGFMINLFEDCDWQNVVVKNTDGTGFGVDCPINSTIKNCTAINCGKGGKIYGPTAPGASGFGIGTGYSDNETIYISNCIATGNFKYGFFFEHQGRFNNLYNATKGNSFVVSNCTAKGNKYDFGGERANDVTYENCVSQKDSANVSAIHFENMTRRTHVINCKVEQKFTDVSNSSLYYYEPVYWALNNAIAEGISKTEFAPLQNATRAQVITFIWRMAERPGDVVYLSGDELNKQFETGYTDVSNNASYVDAVKWAKEQGIISADSQFYPNDGCTRAQFITMLWRYAGKPTVSYKNNFTDVTTGAYYEDAVNWAVSKGILEGKGNNKFAPNDICLRAEAVTFIYRFNNNNNNNKFSITYNLGEGRASNKTTYIPGKDVFTLKNPTRLGYTFAGWTGSNYSEYVSSSSYKPKETVKVTADDKGNKTYTANWVPNTYIITFEDNGGTGIMTKQYITYDSVPQTLLENEFKKEGYAFNGWNTSVNGTGRYYKDGQLVQNLTGNITLYAQWTATTKNAQYKVEHYKQNIDGTYPVKPENTETLNANAGTKVTPSTKTYEGFTAPSLQQVIISADGSTVVKYKYIRNSYTVNVNQGEGIESVTGAKTYKYEEQVTLSATLKQGYENIKWIQNGKVVSSSFKMPAGNVAIQVNAQLIGKQEEIREEEIEEHPLRKWFRRWEKSF